LPEGVASAEALRLYARDSVPEGTFQALQDDVHAGVVEVAESDHQGQPVSGGSRIRVNFGDLGQRMGVYPAPVGSPPDIPGLELAGEVVAAGRFAERFTIGDRVMGVVGGGAQAQLLAVHERQLMPVPESLTWQQAGGFPEAFVTAHDALVTQSGVRPGDRVLITGAAGGVAGVQIAAALRGEGYVTQLAEVYGEKHPGETFEHDTLSSHPKVGRHFQRQRVSFYMGED
jgi:hypothetical protein